MNPKAVSPSSDPLFFALQELLVGRYSLDAELGRGSMGVIYLARDVRLDRPVALKVLSEALAGQPEVRDRFLREARTAAKLSHPNIVPIHAVEEVDRFVFFAMSYIAGETLGERVRRRGPVGSAELMRILREVAWALSYAHGEGVIHRDLKPDNILLEDGSGRALVADFGIARVTEAGGATGEASGTVEFMCPEQAMAKGVDARSDIYSLGLVALYALSGRLPVQGPSREATRELVRQGEVPSVREMVNRVPRAVARIVDTCLRYDPEARFPSAHLLAEALESASASRKEIPVPVRTFLYDPIDLGGDAPAYFTVGFFASFPMLVSVLAEPASWPALLLYSGLVVGPTFLVGPRIRRLLRSGNTLADLEAGLRQDLEQRREELPSVERTTWNKVSAWMQRGGLAGAAVSWTAVCYQLYRGVMSSAGDPWGPATIVPLLVMVGFFGVAQVGRFGEGADRETRDLRRAARRLKFWQSRIGRWLFKFWGKGLETRVTEVRATHRPTELQIGLAAEALYEALPSALKTNLGNVPAMVKALEHDASTLRRCLEAINDAETSRPRLDAELPTDLQEVRGRAERQLSDVVAAMETIRLGLLRLTLGSGNVESLTTHLDAASELGHGVQRLLAGLDLADAVLLSSGEPELGVST